MEEWRERLQRIAEAEQQRQEEEKQVAEAVAGAHRRNTEAAKKWLREQVEPAFGELVTELKKYSKKAWWDGGDLERLLHVDLERVSGFVYGFELRASAQDITGQRRFKAPDHDHTSPVPPPEDGPATSVRREQNRTPILDWTKEDIISDFMHEYETWKGLTSRTS